MGSYAEVLSSSLTWSSSFIQLVCVWWVLTYKTVDIRWGVCWLAKNVLSQHFFFSWQRKSVSFFVVTIRPQKRDPRQNDAKRCKIQFKFQKYTSRNDSTNNKRVIKTNIYSIGCLRTPFCHIPIQFVQSPSKPKTQTFCCVFIHGEVRVRTRYPSVTFHRSINWAIGAPNPID